MSLTNFVKVVVFIPADYADRLRQAAGEAGAGHVGNYSFCSFSSRGIGRFKPENGAEPFIGCIGKIEEVEEERIEFVCARADLDKIIAAIKRVHPYEEIALELISLEMFGVENKK